jgi:hypothetical protein
MLTRYLPVALILNLRLSSVILISSSFFSFFDSNCVNFLIINCLPAVNPPAVCCASVEALNKLSLAYWSCFSRASFSA